MPARASACVIAMAAPVPAGSGAEIWWPSDDSPQPHNATVAHVAARSGSALITKNAAASPILIPWRFTLIGLHGTALTDSSAEKPATVNPHRVSTPPVSTT